RPGRALAADAPTRLAAVALGDQQLAVLARLHGRDLAGPAGAAALLRAVLHDALVLPGRLDAAAAFDHVVAQRLLDVDVLAGLAGPDGHQRMPVVRRGDGEGVQLLVVEGLPDVPHALRCPAPLLLDGPGTRLEQAGIGIDQVGDLHALKAKVLLD